MDEMLRAFTKIRHKLVPKLSRIRTLNPKIFGRTFGRDMASIKA
jgi:hypothetical protein